MNDVLRAAAVADDYDSAKVVAAYLNADCLMQEALARDPAGWTAERVLAVGRLMAEAFRDGRIPAPATGASRPAMHRVEMPETLSSQQAGSIGLDAVGASLNGGADAGR